MGSRIVKSATEFLDQPEASLKFVQEIDEKSSLIGTALTKLNTLTADHSLESMAETMTKVDAMDLLKACCEVFDQGLSVEVRDCFKEQVPKALEDFESGFADLCKTYLRLLVAFLGARDESACGDRLQR